MLLFGSSLVFQKRSEVLHIFNALSNNDIRFQSVDVSSPLTDTEASVETSSLQRSSAALDSAVQGSNARAHRIYKLRQFVERERYNKNQGLWREKLYQKLFLDATDDSLKLELPQIWAVTENGLDGTPDSALRVPICEVP